MCEGGGGEVCEGGGGRGSVGHQWQRMGMGCLSQASRLSQTYTMLYCMLWINKLQNVVSAMEACACVFHV